MSHVRKTGRAAKPWRGIAVVDGIRRSRSFRTMGEAREWANDVESRARRGLYVDERQGRETLGDLVERYLDDVRPALSARRVEQIERLYRNHVAESIGRKPVAAIGPETLRAWIAERLRVVGPPTVREALQIVSRVLDDAVDDGRLARNPARSRSVKVPTPRPSEYRVVTPTEARRLLREIAPEYRLPPLLAYGAGLRWGEAIALRLTNLDLLRRELRVVDVVEESSAGLVVRPYPKSRSSRRTVPLPTSLVDEVAALLAITGAPDDGEPIARGPRGGLLRRSAYSRRVWTPAIERAEIAEPFPTFHDLRHSHATELLAGGLGLEDLRVRLGHSDARMTMRYVHIAEDHRDRVDRVSEERFGSALRGLSGG